jgi:hypothetical protein
VVDGVDGQDASLVEGASLAPAGDRWGGPQERWGQVRRGDHAEPAPAARSSLEPPGTPSLDNTQAFKWPGTSTLWDAEILSQGR